MKKLRSGKGETITETLVALLIIAAVFVFLAAAIVTAARVNESFKQKDVTFIIDGEPENMGSVTANITHTVDGEEKTIVLTAAKYHVNSGNREKGYDYYEYQATVPTP